MRSPMRLRMLWASGVAAVLGAVLLGTSGMSSPPSRPAVAIDSSRRADPVADSTLWIAMREVNLHIDDTHVMHVRELHGEVQTTHSGAVPFLDDPSSFRIRVTSGTVDLTGPDLAALLNGYVFAY